MNQDTQRLVSLITISVYAEQVFGPITTAVELKDKFRAMAKLLHPDTFDVSCGVPKAKAEEAFKKLNSFEDLASKRIDAGIYGDILALLSPIIVTTKKEVYTLTRKLPPTDIANAYRGVNKAGTPIILKVAKSHADNDLIQNEASILKKLQTEATTRDLKTVIHHTPKVLDSFVNISGTTKQGVVVFESGDADCFNLSDVKKAFPNGVSLEHLAWMFNRLLGSLEGPHTLDIAHGGILPQNFVIFPKTHNGVLTNWDFAVKSGEKLKGIMGGGLSRVFYPPEVFNKEPVDLSLDLYMAAKLFIYMSGGNEGSNTFPAGWEKVQTAKAKDGYRKIKGLIAACLLGKGCRTKEVAVLYTDFRAALEYIFGPPTWREFKMP